MREVMSGSTLAISYKEIKKWLALPLEDETIISSIVEDIRFVEEGSIFVVRRGSCYDCFQDIDEALMKGAYVLHEDQREKRGFYVPGLFEVLDDILAYVYRFIFDDMCLVAVCGSNGKSSVVTYLEVLLKAKRCMCIGTHFVSIDGEVIKTNNTTPNRISLMHYIALAKRNRVDYILMEVSSHAIAERRIDLLRFDYVVYTNISQDHLDYHHTLLHYRYTKYKLCQYLKREGRIIANRDELYYGELEKLYSGRLVTYGKGASHFQISDIFLQKEGSSFYVNRQFFYTNQISLVNVYNISACIAFLRLEGISYYDCFKRIEKMKVKNGRLQCIYEKDFSVYIDYAHTPKAFYESLLFLKMITKGRLLCVVGCGGEREIKKRRLIGMYASYFSDLCIFTEDNSRGENIEDILFDMCECVKGNVVCIESRRDALQYAVKNVQKDDIIIISGKGDEIFLEKKGKRIPFRDRDVVLEMLGDKNGN